MANEPLIGGIFMFAGTFAPRGYQFCQGQLLSIQQNAALFAILGTTFGGNGSTTFALPDLQGRMPVGQGNGKGLPFVQLGEAAGSATVSLTTGNLPGHTHSLNCDSSGSSTTDPTNAFPGNGGFQATPTYYSAGPANATMAFGAIGLTGGGQPVSVQNPFLGINFIIAIQGIFPSRN